MSANKQQLACNCGTIHACAIHEMPATPEESNVDKAERIVALFFRRFAKTVPENAREDFFHGIERDMWMGAFIEYLKEHQDKREKLGASND